ncbi:hypothetical protein KAH27_09555 [bacterium]|nr:hypothetical protein [bacterium]
MYLDLVLKVLGAVALISISVVAFKLVSTLKIVSEKVDKMGSSLENLSKETAKSLISISDNMDVLNVKLVESLTKMDANSEVVVTTIKNVETDVNLILGSLKPYQVLLKSVHDKISPAIYEVTDFMGALSKAMANFTNMFFKKK